MRRFSIAGLQLALGKGDNLDVIDREIRSVKKRFPWLDMVMLPELCTFGPDPAHAQPLPGEAENRYSAIARDLGLWLLPGSMFETRDAQVFNTTPVINPEGAVIARYRKMFPFLPYETGVTPGADFVVFDIPDVGRFGVSICYDMWFPETTRTLAWMGAEVILHPSMTNTVDRDVELSMARSSAATSLLTSVSSSPALASARSIPSDIAATSPRIACPIEVTDSRESDSGWARRSEVCSIACAINRSSLERRII